MGVTQPFRPELRVRRSKATLPHWPGSLGLSAVLPGRWRPVASHSSLYLPPPLTSETHPACLDQKKDFADNRTGLGWPGGCRRRPHTARL